jgi:hypothetical protein
MQTSFLYWLGIAAGIAIFLWGWLNVEQQARTSRAISAMVIGGFVVLGFAHALSIL